MNSVSSELLGDEIPHLRRYAQSLTKDMDRADDLVQDVLERGMSRLESFHPDGNLRAWMFAIMHNLYVDQCRRDKRRGVHLSVEDLVDLIEQPATQVWKSALDDFVEDFGKLKKSEQSVLFLVGLEGLKYEEAADQLGIAIGTVKSRLSRARAALRGGYRGYAH